MGEHSFRLLAPLLILNPLRWVLVG
jgi:hypothetical protein